MRRLISSRWVRMSKPATVPWPPEGSRSPQSIRMVVDLPAPLGPRKPKISPGRTSRLMRLTATKSPNRRSRSRSVTANVPGAAFMRHRWAEPR